MTSQTPEENDDRVRSVQFTSNRKKKQALTVTELTGRIQSLLEREIGEVWVKGEISDIGFPSSGHVYFNLKDENAVLPVALFRRAAGSVEFDLEDGLEVRIRGTVTAYEKRGNYQIIAEEVLPLGEGALQLAFKQLCEKLKEEGLFDEEHKQPLPFLPTSIGVVTSSTGAAIRDIVRTIHHRFPAVHLYVVPVSVQGDEAKTEIANAIQFLNEETSVDVIITGRGGGSLEDLWAFNEEIVARAIFRSRIPVISAVGHEVDTTISDLVADRSVATPTAAGQLVVPERAKLQDELRSRVDTLHQFIGSIIRQKKRKLKRTGETLARLHPSKQLEREKDELVKKMQAIHRETTRILDNSQNRLSSVAEQLESLSPLNILKRGYSITRSAPDGNILKSTEDVTPGDKIETRLSEGSILSRVESVSNSDEQTD